MSFCIDPLPYDSDALSPFISEETLNYHYGKHHNAYLKKLNEAILGSQYEKMDLISIIKSSEGALFNNAAQVWNHSFYWSCMAPAGSNGAPSASLLRAIENKFVTLDNFLKEFFDVAMNQFGSGWAWLISNKSRQLRILSTQNADTPLKDSDNTVLMTCDVWEHSYYIDTRNDRARYLKNFFEVISWKFVSDNFDKI